MNTNASKPLTTDDALCICEALRGLIDSFPNGKHYDRRRNQATDTLHNIMARHNVQWCFRCEEFSANSKPYARDGHHDICPDCVPDHEWSKPCDPEY